MIESFQDTTIPTPAVTEQQCAVSALRSFPIGLSVTPTDLLYESVLEPITMDIQWATRTTPPTFRDTENSNGYLDEVGAGNTSITTIKYNGKSYTLDSVQLTAPSHREWILPRSDMQANKADCILTFVTSADTISYKYIVIVAPLLFTSGTTSPGYLQGLANTSSTGPFTLRSLFPDNPNTLFAYYSSCLNGYTNNASTENVGVFVSVRGTTVNASLMNTIATNQNMTTDTENNFIYPSYTPPFVSRLNRTGQTIGGTFPFTGYVQTTNVFLDYASASLNYRNISMIEREDTLDSYKCVPIDPDKNIEDGKIRVDAESGELLTDVVNEREKVRAADATKGGIEPGRLEKYLGAALGVIMAIILIGSTGYFIYTFFFRKDTPSTVPGAVPGAVAAAAAATVTGDPSTEKGWIMTIPYVLFATVIAALIGFIVGAFMS